MKVILASTIAIAFTVAYSWHWLVAGEEIKYPSPDGRFGLRAEQREGGATNVSLIQTASGQVMVDPGISLHGETLVWSPDSRLAAYRDSGFGSGELKVYF